MAEQPDEWAIRRSYLLVFILAQLLPDTQPQQPDALSRRPLRDEGPNDGATDSYTT